MANKLEVEGKEILIKSSKGLMAVIPKEKVSWVKEQIESGRHGLVDKYVDSLKEFKYDNQKAGDGLYANIHAKRARIAAGSGERMRSPGEAGAPTAGQFKQAAKTAKAEDGIVINPPVNKIAVDATRTNSVIPNVLYPREDLIRPDGTMKDVGFYGEFKSPMGQTVTEYSVGVPIMGREMDIPSLVPGLSEQERNYILQKADRDLNIGRDPIGNSIYKKAAQHAEQRVMKGMSPFYSSVMDNAVPAMQSDATRVNVQMPSMDKPKVVETEKVRMFPVGPLVPFNYYQERKKKEKQKAEDGVKIKPPVKEMAVDVSQVSPIIPPKIIPGQLMPEISITAPAKVNTGIDYANPEDWNLIAPMLLKKANTAIGGNIERGGNDRENYSDLMWRLAHTRGTPQHYLHGTYPNVNKYAGVAGDVILDPVNVAPIGRWAKTGLKGAATLAQASGASKQARNLNILGDAAPWLDRAGDFYSAVKSYMGYGKKKEEGK